MQPINMKVTLRAGFRAISTRLSFLGIVALKFWAAPANHAQHWHPFSGSGMTCGERNAVICLVPSLLHTPLSRFLLAGTQPTEEFESFFPRINDD
jgi:hypothetical protein